MTEKTTKLSMQTKTEAAQGRADREAKALTEAETEERNEKTARLRAQRMQAEAKKKGS